MSITIKQLIERNKQAFDHHYYIESINLSYILINKALKQIIKEELRIEVVEKRIKTSNLIKHINKELVHQPELNVKLSKKAIKDIQLFVALYKDIQKELKYQFPEKKIVDTSLLGLNCIVMLNTSLLKIKHNNVN